MKNVKRSAKRTPLRMEQNLKLTKTDLTIVTQIERIINQSTPSSRKAYGYAHRLPSKPLRKNGWIYKSTLIYEFKLNSKNIDVALTNRFQLMMSHPAKETQIYRNRKLEIYFYNSKSVRRRNVLQLIQPKNEKQPEYEIMLKNNIGE